MGKQIVSPFSDKMGKQKYQVVSFDRVKKKSACPIMFMQCLQMY